MNELDVIMDRLEGQVRLLQWMIGLNMALTLGVLWKVMSL